MNGKYTFLIFSTVSAVVLIGGAYVFSGIISAATSDTVDATIKISVCGNDIAEGGEQCDGDDLRGMVCTNLGFSGGDLSCSASCEFVVSACTASATATANPAFTAASGGEYTLTDSNNSAKITLPENFYTKDVTLHMLSYNKSAFESSKPAPSGKSFIGKAHDFVFIDSDGAAVSTFFQPATLVFTYTDADVSGVDESTLAPYRHDGSSWQLISGATIDTANNKVTFSTAAFSSFTLFGSPQQEEGQQEEQQQSSGGGGGGGGGGVILSPTGVTFSGRAYPKSIVTLLKDAQIAATTIAGADANFSVSVSGISGGSYIFSVYSEDDKGIRSSLLTFPISVASGSTAKVGGIFIAPTIAVDKSEVKRGDNITIFGQSAPNSEITIEINSDEEFFGKTKADQNGAYLYNFDTSPLAMEQHLTRSKAAYNGEISSFGKSISFLVGTKNIVAELAKVAAKGDMNNDKRVNLVDFSIAAYWYKRPSPPATADLNGDGKVDLIDFSIMAFYWTG